MATLWIDVYASAAEVALGDLIESHSITIGSSTAQMSGVIQGETEFPKGPEHRRIRLFADADCHVAWGSNPLAVTTGQPLGSENPEYFAIKSGQKVAVLERV